MVYQNKLEVGAKEAILLTQGLLRNSSSLKVLNAMHV